MAHKYDAAASKKRRVQFLVLLIVGPIGYGLTEKLIIPTTSLEEILWVFAKIGFLFVALIAAVGILANLIAELNHAIEDAK